MQDGDAAECIYTLSFDRNLSSFDQLQALGSTSLREVRDALCCSSDLLACAPYENYYFVLEDSLYVSDQCVNINDKQVLVNKVNMGSTFLSSLRLQIGKEYSLVHQGGCRHALHIEGCHFQQLISSSFPRHLFAGCAIRKYCELCGDRWARHVFIDCPLSGRGETFLCLECTKISFYDESNELLPEFESMSALPYVSEPPTTKTWSPCM